MKTFYNEKYKALNEVGRQASSETYRFLRDFNDRWLAMGFDPREIQSLIIEETVTMAAEIRLLNAFKKQKEEKGEGK